MALSQTDRLIRIATPLGDGTFIVLSFSGVEELSDLFRFELELASERNDITFDQLAGKNVTVGLRSSDTTERCFNGIITALSPVQISEKEGYSTYTAVMEPALWVLTECYDCRIFQDVSVPDIITDVLGQGSLGKKGVTAKIDFRLALSGNYAPKPIASSTMKAISPLSAACANMKAFSSISNMKTATTPLSSPTRPTPINPMPPDRSAPYPSRHP